ncbi:UNVERIFIED_CONTAM: MFS transporter, partial [Bacteroidetes bacterium 56_B9]
WLGAYGWRGAYVALALLTAVGIPLIALLLRSEMSRARPDARAAGADWRLYADRRFALIAVVFLLASVGIFGTIVHFVPLLTDRGIAPARAA